MGFENGKLLRVTLRATLGDRQMVNTFHYDLVDATYPAQDNNPQTLADLFRDNVRPKFAGIFLARWNIEPVVVVMEKDPLNPAAVRSEWVSGVATPGTRDSAGTLGPSGATVVASLYTDHIGRRFRGRLFLGGDHRQDTIVNNAWTAGTLTALYQPILAAVPMEPDLAPAVSTSTARWCVYSRTQRAADLDPYASPVAGYILRPAVHWLRRRAGIG